MKPKLFHLEQDVTDDLIQEADAISLPRVDEAAAQPMPTSIAEPWIGKEYDEYANEQPDLWEGTGEEEARPFAAQAAGLEAATKGTTDLIALQKQKLEAAVAYTLLVLRVLQRFLRRRPQAKFWYVVTWMVLLAGDIAGIAGAAILRGEIVSLAVLQAVSAAMAAVTSGLIGQDIRDLVLAHRRQRDLDMLTDDERPFAHLFQGSHDGVMLIRGMVYVAATIALFIAGGIMALRASVDGASGGLIFGLIAAAICLASCLNCYIYTDEVADLIDSAEASEAKARKQFETLISSVPLRQRAEALEEAASIKREHLARGKAASTKFKALKYRVYRQNPAVLGHGPAAIAPNPLPPSTFGKTERARRNGKVGA